MFDYSIFHNPLYLAHWDSKECSILSSTVGWITVINYYHDLANTQESHYVKGGDFIDTIIYWIELCG